MNFRKSLLITLVLLISTAAFSQLDTKDSNGYRMINLQEQTNANITFQDILDLYKGKVIYLDFWASWCGPCKKEMPNSAILKEKLAGKDVVFVYISSDRTESAWRNGVEQLNIKGENYLTSARVWQDYNSLFDVKYIPRYILIDKDGKVVDANAKRPSNPEVLNDINALL